MSSRRPRLLVAALLAVAVVAASPSVTYAATGPTPPPTAPTPRPLPKPPTPPPPTTGRTTLPLAAGDTGALVAAAQQRLVWMGHPLRITRVMDAATVKAVAAFRVKFFLGSGRTITQPVWNKLVALTHTHGVLPKACRTGTILCIDKTQKLLRYVRNGKVVLTTDARFGAASTPTREGLFRIYAKARDHTSTLYHSWMPYAMFFSGGQAVHYSPFFHRDGYYGASHGCIGLRTIAVASWLFDRVPIGTRVLVYRS